jgi:hypothetical protein
MGLLSFVSRMYTCTSFLALFLQRPPPTALNRSSLEVVWDLLLKAGPEGSTLIDYTARPRLIRSCNLLIRVLLQRTYARISTENKEKILV